MEAVNGSVALPPVVEAGEIGTLRDRVTLLDVRGPAEFAAEHIPGSYNVPLELLPEHAGRLAAAAKTPVVLVCRSGVRARQAEQALRSADFPALHVLDGGIGASRASGLPVVEGSRRWSMERQVRGAAGALVVAGSLAGLFVSQPLTVLPALVGGGLLFSAVTDTCGMAKLLARLPYNRATSARCDISGVVSGMAAKSAAGAN